MEKIYNIFLRYAILILIALPNLYLFYFLFTPLTIYPVYFILNLFFEVSLENNLISSPGFSIQIIQACVAGSAYYLLTILNLSTPNIKFKRRTKILIQSLLILLVINIIRIASLTFCLNYLPNYFDISHKIFWLLGSTIFVVLIWFFEVKLYKIKEIPFYSDLKFLQSKIKC
jgi:exosortase/archaeosortase family protein